MAVSVPAITSSLGSPGNKNEREQKEISFQAVYLIIDIVHYIPLARTGLTCSALVTLLVETIKSSPTIHELSLDPHLFLSIGVTVWGLADEVVDNMHTIVCRLSPGSKTSKMEVGEWRWGLRKGS